MPQLNGEIHHIGQPKKVTDNFTKVEFIVVTEKNTKYPQYIQLYLANQKMDLIKDFREGQQVSVDYNLQGRLDKNDNTKCFNQLQAYKIQRV